MQFDLKYGATYDALSTPAGALGLRRSIATMEGATTFVNNSAGGRGFGGDVSHMKSGLQYWRLW